MQHVLKGRKSTFIPEAAYSKYVQIGKLFCQRYQNSFNLPMFYYRVVFQKIVQTSKPYMREITPVEVEWLNEFTPMFAKSSQIF